MNRNPQWVNNLIDDFELNKSETVDADHKMKDEAFRRFLEYKEQQIIQLKTFDKSQKAMLNLLLLEIKNKFEEIHE